MVDNSISDIILSILIMHLTNVLITFIKRSTTPAPGQFIPDFIWKLTSMPKATTKSLSPNLTVKKDLTICVCSWQTIFKLRFE